MFNKKLRFFQKKDIQDVLRDAAQMDLKKNLGAMDLLFLGLGGIIGTGIFVLTGQAAARYAGPAITVSFLVSGIACIFTALAYAELASILPVSGSIYTYSYVALGEGFAALAGWTACMVFSFGSATVASGWSGYVVGVLNSIGIHLPDLLVKIPTEGGFINLPAVMIVIALTAILWRGNSGTKKLTGILVAIKLGAIFLFILAAFPHIHSVHWEIFAPKGCFGILAGASFVFMAYNGFDVLATAAGECKNPNRDIPIGIIGSLVGSALLYVIVSGILTSIVHYSSLDNPEPMAQALRQNGVRVGAALVATGAIAGMATVILSQIYGQSRVLFVMARDGLLPPSLTRVHSRFNTPHIGLLISSVIVSLIAGFMPTATLGQMSSMAALAVFSTVSLGVMILRYKMPHLKRSFRCPAIYLIASASMILCVFLFAQLFLEVWIPYGACTLIGICVYLFYGSKNSTLNIHAD